MQRPGMAKYLMEASDFEWEEGLDFLKKYMQREGNIANFRSNMAVSGKVRMMVELDNTLHKILCQIIALLYGNIL